MFASVESIGAGVLATQERLIAIIIVPEYVLGSDVVNQRHGAGHNGFFHQDDRRHAPDDLEVAANGCDIDIYRTGAPTGCTFLPTTVLTRIIHEALEAAVLQRDRGAVFRGVGDAVVGV